MDTAVIVIVEDNEPVALLLREVLNDVPGYGAVSVGDAARALDVIAAVQPDLLIMDVDLPGLSGFDLLELVRRHPNPRVAEVQVLLISGGPYRDEAAQRQLAFLAKPFDLDEALDLIRRLLDRPPPPAEVPGLHLPM